MRYYQVMLCSILISFFGCRTLENDNSLSDSDSPVDLQINDVRAFNAAGLTSQYRVLADQNYQSEEKRPLVIYLHGDTGSNYARNNETPAPYHPLLKREQGYGQPLPTIDQAKNEASLDTQSIWRKAVVASIISPTWVIWGSSPIKYFNTYGETNRYQSDRVITWHSDLPNKKLDSHADYVKAVIESVQKEYNTDPNKVIVVGQSGGGNFLGTLIPKLSPDYGLGAVMLCGGMKPRDDLLTMVESNSDFLGSFKLHIHTTQGDYQFLKDGMESAYDYYLKKLTGRNSVTFATDGNDGHCLFKTQSQPKIIESFLKNFL